MDIYLSETLDGVFQNHDAFPEALKGPAIGWQTNAHSLQLLSPFYSGLILLGLQRVHGLRVLLMLDTAFSKHSARVYL